MASGSDDHSIRLWNTTSSQCLGELTGHTVNCLGELIDGRLISGSDDYSIRLWNTTTNECIDKLSDHRDKIINFIVLSDDRMAFGSIKSTIKLNNIRTNNYISSLSLTNEHCFCLIKLINGILVSGHFNTIKLLDIDNNEYFSH